MRRSPRMVNALVLFVFAVSGRRARAGGVSRTEECVFRSVNELPDGLHGPVWAVMQSGSLAAVFAAAGVHARRNDRHRAAATLLVGLGVWGGVKVIKPLIGRGRPTAEIDRVRVRGHRQTGLGFPSGHSAVAATLAIALTDDRSCAATAGALGVAVVTGGARLYVGAHLPLDIVGGLAIGVLGGAAATRAIESAGGSR